MTELLDAQKAPAPGSAANIAWFAVQVKTDTYVYFADRTDAANGAIDPVFLLAAYAMEAKPHRVRDIRYNIVAGYDVAGKWKTALAGIASLISTQSATDAISIGGLQRSNKLPDGQAIQWTKITLASAATRVPTVPSTRIIDDVFVPQRTQYASDANVMLIGAPAWGTHTIPRLYMMAAILLESARQASVVSLVVDKQGTIVAHGIKGPNDGGCSHAEVRAIFALKGQLPDTGGALFGTLKPCNMCAGLLHATDPTGKFRKYWVRDDNNEAAQWSNIGPGFKLENGHRLDKSCANVKYLKVGGDSFFEKFNSVRSKADQARQNANIPADREKVWYAAWARKYNFPKGGQWSNLRYLNDQRHLEDSIKPRLISSTVEGSMSLTTFVNQHLAFKDLNPKKNPKGWNGMTAEYAAKITDAWSAHKKEQFAAEFPGQIIKFIPWNPGSVALSNSARDAFKAKQKKYHIPEKTDTNPQPNSDAWELSNPNVKAVMDYLTGYLRQMNVDV